MPDNKQVKVNGFQVRLTDRDKKDLDYLCQYREMNKSEMVVYLIRREADKLRDYESRF